MPSASLAFHPSLSADRIREIQAAQQNWADLAEAADREATRVTEVLAGRPNSFGYSSPDVSRKNAEMYRAVVKSFDLELETGKPHCSCCFKPITPHRY